MIQPVKTVCSVFEQLGAACIGIIHSLVVASFLLFDHSESFLKHRDVSKYNFGPVLKIAHLLQLVNALTYSLLELFCLSRKFLRILNQRSFLCVYRLRS